MTLEKCTATNKDGRPCSAQVWRDEQCRWHHPDLEAARAEGRRRGGRNRGNAARAKKQLPAEVMSDEELLSWLGVAFKSVLVGKMAPNIGTAAAGIARAMNSVRQSTELEERLAALEERAGLRSAS